MTRRQIDGLLLELCRIIPFFLLDLSIQLPSVLLLPLSRQVSGIRWTRRLRRLRDASDATTRGCITTRSRQAGPTLISCPKRLLRLSHAAHFALRHGLHQCNFLLLFSNRRFFLHLPPHRRRLLFLLLPPHPRLFHGRFHLHLTTDFFAFLL